MSAPRLSAEEREQQVLDLLGDRELTTGDLVATTPAPEREPIYQALERLRWKGVLLRRREDSRRRSRAGAGPVYVYFRAPGPLAGEVAQLEAALAGDLLSGEAWDTRALVDIGLLIHRYLAEHPAPVDSAHCERYAAWADELIRHGAARRDRLDAWPTGKP